MTSPHIAVVTSDPVLAEQVRKRSDPSWRVTVLDPTAELSAQPAAIVLDLKAPNAPEMIRDWKQRWPSTLVACSLVVPSREAWEEAEGAGADLVANRGAFMARFTPRFKDWQSAPGGRRIRLFGMNEIAGRLGVVHRMVDPVAGPIAVYHLKGSVFATHDVCPHAGRLLSEGEIEESVVTCPGHGSQFDVRTGRQVRGPSDGDIATFRVVVENLEVFVEFDS